MKWMLVVVVLGIAPVKTELMFDSLGACWAAREGIAKEYTDVANGAFTWAYETLEGEMRNQTVELVRHRLLTNAITCIPHAELRD